MRAPVDLDPVQMTGVLGIVVGRPALAPAGPVAIGLFDLVGNSTTRVGDGAPIPHSAKDLSASDRRRRHRR
jgi:hypothetical protein